MEKLNQKEVVSALLSIVLKTPDIHTPMYLDFLKTEQECDEWMDSLDATTPLVYIWNEDRELGTYNVSVSGKEVAYWLQELNLVTREHPQFNDIRDESMLAISEVSKQAISCVCSEHNLFPSDVYKLPIGISTINSVITDDMSANNIMTYPQIQAIEPTENMRLQKEKQTALRVFGGLVCIIGGGMAAYSGINHISDTMTIAGVVMFFVGVIAMSINTHSSQYLTNEQRNRVKQNNEYHDYWRRHRTI